MKVARRKGPLVRDMLYVPEEMTARLDALALACKVPRSAVVRAAVIAWLKGAEHWVVGVVMEAIRVASQRMGVRLRRYSQRWPEEVRVRLNRVVNRAGLALPCKVSLSVVVRVAIAVWFDGARVSPAWVTEANRAAQVPRGRKAKR